MPLLMGVALGLGAMGLPAVHAAVAAAAEAEARPHLGERLAVYLRSTMGLPDWAILLVLSSLPVIELRGGVPVGLWMGMSVPTVVFLCSLGNALPVPLILLALRMPRVKRLLAPLLNRAQTKVGAIGAHDRWVGIAAFVGVPLPGTGAWTGAMVAYLLGMDFFAAITSVTAGVVIAACIMASLTLAGWYGAAIAGALVAVALGSRFLPWGKR